ncbi:MAG: hypothetical protein JWR27_3011 [Aeromicrobium sp.]|jgi:hypothetical protein|nr:hypothetical protein [Aeromicrobium sp.]
MRGARAASKLVETITVDCATRKDCAIPTSFSLNAPTLICTDPVVLTP